MWNFENANCDLRLELKLSEQTIETLLQPEFWRSLCPFLSINDIDLHGLNQGRSNALEGSLLYKTHSSGKIESLGHALNDRGFFRFPEEEMSLPIGISEKLAWGVRRLVAHGYAPTYLLMYDEAWIVGDLVKSILEKASGNAPVGDWYVFLVDPLAPGGYRPGPPHRDRPTADSTSFRPLTGAPMYCSCWLALTDATPENSCLYLIPKADDKGYHAEGDAIVTKASQFSEPLLWQKIVAQPLKAGGMLTFSHRLLHWGSNLPPHDTSINTSITTRVQLTSLPLPPPLRPRIALSLAFADPAFEAPYFDPILFLPFPPVGLRLGLIAGQLIQYEHLAPLEKYDIALLRRIFHSQKQYFGTVYFDKISSAVQFLAFQKRQTR